MYRFVGFVASAVLLHLSLWSPPFFFWCSFIWLTPLFYLAFTQTKAVSWRDGLVWGLLFYSLHLIPVTHLFVCQAQGVGRFIFPVLLIFYCAFHVALWFLLAATSAWLLGDGKFARGVAWFAWTTIFIVWVPDGLLWISGQYIGYPLSFPLLPLAQYPALLWLLPILGRAVLVMLQVGVGLSMTLLFMNHFSKSLFLVAFCLLPFVSGLTVRLAPKKLPDFFYTLGYVCPPKVTEGAHPMDARHPMDVAQEVYYRMRAVLENHPKVTVLVMPELSYRFALNEHPHVVALWCNNALHENVSLFIGACRRDRGKVYNSLYYIKEGCIAGCYDKSRLMPLVEYVPAWLKKIPGLCSLFLNDNEFCAVPCDGKLFHVSQECFCEPYICAEIFFGKMNTSQARVRLSDNTLILSILNDVVLEKQIQSLMLLWNSFQAIQWRQVRVHVGYKNAFFIMPDGNRHAIS